MEKSVLFSDSPLAKYLAEVNLEPPDDLVFANPVSSILDVSEAEDVTPSSGGWLWQPSFRLHGLNRAYRMVLNSDDSSLEEDFCEVKSAVRENVTTWSALVPGPAMASLCLSAALASFFSWWLLLAGWFVFLMLIWVRFRAFLQVPDHVLCLHDAFVRLEKQLTKSVNVVREVELVSRGFRVGATVQSPISLVELIGGRDREIFLAKLRGVCVQVLEEVFDECEAVLNSFTLKGQPAFSTDVQELANLFKQIKDDDDAASTIKGLMTRSKALKLGHVGLCCLQLRASIFNFLAPSLYTLTKMCLAGADRISDARLCSDWRKAPTDSKGEGWPKEIGALQSGLRTVGARSILYVELLKKGKIEEAEQERLSIGADLSRLSQDWEYLCQQKTSAPAEQSAPIAAKKEPMETLQMGGMETDVIGGQQDVLVQQKSRVNLEDILKVYEARIGAEEQTSKIPTVSREERIREMYERRAAEERAHAESRAVYALIDELENVLKRKK